MPNYKKVILASGPEILSVRNPISNPLRNYIAGLDPIEDSDRKMMQELSLPLQHIGAFAPAVIRERAKQFRPQRSPVFREGAVATATT